MPEQPPIIQPIDTEKKENEGITSSSSQLAEIENIQDFVKKITESESIKKKDIRDFVIVLRQFLDSVKTDVEHQEKLETLQFSGNFTVGEGSSTINISYKEDPQIKECIKRYQTLNIRLKELDSDFFDEKISSEYFNLLRPIMIAKLGHLVKTIGLSAII